MVKIRELFRRPTKTGEERQTEAAYEAAKRQLEKRRARLESALDLGDLIDRMQEAREND